MDDGRSSLKSLNLREITVMSQELLVKLFENKQICVIWDEGKEDYYFCVNDIVSRYWKGDAMKDEIDLVAVDDAEKRVMIAECKRNPKKYNEQLLRSKSAAIVSHHKAYSVEYAGLSLKDMD